MISPTPRVSFPPLIRRELPGGLTLLMRENHDVAVATVDVWVRAGAADEPPEIAGVSHFLEHMMFKGTERFAPGQIERELENVGGLSNAGTSHDFTHYYVTLPSASVDLGIDMIAEMMRGARLDAAELEKERIVILEEFRRKQDDPEAMLFEDLFEQLFESGAYHQSVIGSEETIRAITRERMADYYRRQYAPGNMALLVTGDVDPAAVAHRAEEAFAGFDRTFAPLPAAPGPPRAGRSKHFHREKPTGGEVYFALACAAPGAKDLDSILPLDAAQFALGQGRSSILFQEIKERLGLASTIACHYSTLRRASLFAITATCGPEQVEPLRKALDEQLARFAETDPEEDQLARARRLIGSSFLFSFETTGGASSQTGYYYTLTGGTDFLESYLDRLASVGIQDVRRAYAVLPSPDLWTQVTVGPTDGTARIVR